MKYSTGQKALLYSALTLVSIVFIAPFIWMILTSLKPHSKLESALGEWLPRVHTMTNIAGQDYPIYICISADKNDTAARKQICIVIEENIYPERYILTDDNGTELIIPSGQTESVFSTVEYRKKHYPVYRFRHRKFNTGIIIRSDLPTLFVLPTINGMILTNYKKLFRVNVRQRLYPLTLSDTVIYKGKRWTITDTMPAESRVLMLSDGTAVTGSKERIVPTASLIPHRHIVFQFKNYLIVLKPEGEYNFLRMFINSIVVALLVTFGQMLTCSLAAYAFARIRFFARDAIFIVYLATMMIPMNITQIPVYDLFKSIGWDNSYTFLIVPQLTGAYGTFLLRQFFKQIPRDLEDASVIDGCTRWQIYRHVFLPLSAPALAAMGYFTFTYVWNDITWPLIGITNPKLYTLPWGFYQFVSHFTKEWNLAMAGAVFSVIPLIILFIILQRFIVKGIVMSGLKG